MLSGQWRNRGAPLAVANVFSKYEAGAPDCSGGSNTEACYVRFLLKCEMIAASPDRDTSTREVRRCQRLLPIAPWLELYARSNSERGAAY